MKPLLLKTQIPFLLLVFMALATVGQTNKFSTYYNQKLSLFEKLPDTKGEIIFLGNSITDGCEWSELLGNQKVKNRGISGDTTEGVLFRLYEVTRSKPDKIFLLIGINDISKNVPNDTVFGNICRIVNRVKHDSPKTKIYVQSILPVDETSERFKNLAGKEGNVIAINAMLKGWCSKENVPYIDLYSRFKSEGSEKINPKYSNEGLHLMGEGYLLWAEIIKPYLSAK